MAQTYTNASLPGGSDWRKRYPSEPIPSTPLSLTPPPDDYRQRPGYQRDPAEQDPTQPDPVAAARNFLGPSTPPQPGETRTANGETRTWDGQGWVLSDGATAGPYVGPGGFQVSSSDTPGQAFGHEIGRTVGEASLGLLRSPLDALKGLFHLPGQALSGLKTLAQDPSLLGEIPEALQAVGNATPFSAETDPKEMGSLLGQVMLGAKGGPTAALAKPLIRPAIGLTGKALTGTGKAMTAVGETTRGAGSIGAAFGLGTGNVPGAVAAMTVPPMLRGAGRIMQKGGAKLEQVGANRPSIAAMKGAWQKTGARDTSYKYGPPRQSTEVPGSSYPRTEPPGTTPEGGPVSDGWPAASTLRGAQPPRSPIFEDVFGPDTAPTDAAGNPIGMGSVDMTGRTTGGNPMGDFADFGDETPVTFEGGALPPAGVKIPGYGDRIVNPFEKRSHKKSIEALKALAEQDPSGWVNRVVESFLKNPDQVYEMDRTSPRPRAR